MDDGEGLYFSFKGGMLTETDVMDPPRKDRYLGKLKLFLLKDGYGFLSCEETFQQYRSDVYVHQNELLDNATVRFLIGEAVSFAVELNSKGRPQARDVRRRFEGKVKSYFLQNGYGFIACSEQGLFDGDVFLHKNQADKLKLTIGDEVTFAVQVSDKGQAQARNVQLNGPKVMSVAEQKLLSSLEGSESRVGMGARPELSATAKVFEPEP